MRAVSRDDAPIIVDRGVQVRLQEIGGGMSASFIRLPSGADLGPALKGRADGPHWGYIVRGRLQMRAADGESVYEAGQAVYWAPGHVAVALEDCEYVGFSPTGQFAKVIERVRVQAADTVPPPGRRHHVEFVLPEDQTQLLLRVLQDDDWAGDLLFTSEDARNAFLDALTAGEISVVRRHIPLTDACAELETAWAATMPDQRPGSAQ